MQIFYCSLKNSCYANSCYEKSCQPRDDCTSTSLSIQILQVRFSFSIVEAVVLLVTQQDTDNLKSSSYTLEVLGLLKIFKSSQYLAWKMPLITLVKASIANSKIWLRKSTQRHIILSLLSIAVSPVDPARIGRQMSRNFVIFTSKKDFVFVFDLF